MNIYSDFICNNKKLETTQISINRWMDKEIVVYPSKGKWLNNKKELVTKISSTMNVSHNNYADVWKNQRKMKYML